MTDRLMRCHPSPLARTVGGKPPQTRDERGALAGVSEIVFHTPIPNIEPGTTNHQPPITNH